MKLKKTLKLMMASALLLSSVSVGAQQLAFPGAQGWGRFATGGRTGTVYHVTNLNDSGAGSLRDAVSKPNRIVVFDVAGVINIKDRIVFSNNLYVAGQTAPGEGITVYGNGVSFTGASNIIVRYMRFRMGHKGSSGKDAAGLANGANMIFDHCSFSWGLDETFSINPDGKGTTPQNITLQNSVVGQGLMTHSAGGLMQANYISIIGNLLIDNATRNFKIKGINQYANNIVYNWKNGAYIMGGDSEGTSYVNIQSNLFINGPAVGGDAFTGGNADFHAYVYDNWQDKNRDGVFNPSEVTNYSGATVESTPYDYPELTLNPGRTLLETNLPTVGASLPYRDPADYYMADEVMSYGKSGALISNEETLACGAPSTWNVYKGEARLDSDNDGMPDEWEKANGTDPNKDDAMVIAANGYTNIENYINSITVNDRDYFLRVPVALTLDKATTTTLAISWRDYTYEEEGFAIEIKSGTDGFKEVGRTAANATSYTLSDLEPGTKYTVRIRAFAGNKTSDYTAETAMSTRPLEADVVDVDTYVADYTWTGGNYDKTQADGNKVLLAPTASTTLTLAESTQPSTIVYKADADLSLGGAAIAGATSMNKSGEGTLTLTGSNTYTGATVLHEGVLEFSTLKDGGEASAIGSSVEFAQNWIADGGTYRYTGGNTTTNRSMKLSQTSTLDVQSATVTMNGVIEGEDASADMIIDGKGQITVGTTDFFGYKGATVLKGSTLYLSTTAISQKGIGSSSKLVLAGGELKTKGETEGYETYSFPIETVEETTSQLTPNRNCYITSKVTGPGDIQFNIPYLREYLKGDWSGFTGHLIANGTNSSMSLLLLEKGYENTLGNVPVNMKGTTRLCAWDTNANGSIGGLSGDASTRLWGSSKQTTNFKCSWTVGSANTDETFNGVIENYSCDGKDRTSSNAAVSITKVGTGVWRLNGNNTHAGTTTVNGGTLVVNGNNSKTTSVTVGKDAILAGQGTLAPATTVSGMVQSGDTLANGRGLTINSNLTLNEGAEVNVLATRTNCNTLTVKGTLTIGGNVVLKLNDGVLLEAPYDQVEYKLFSVTGGIAGTFAEILPATPGEGQTWDTSRLYTDGILTVVGGEERPDDPTPDPEPEGETQKVCLAWGNMSHSPSDSNCTKLEGTEATPSNNIGFTMTYTTATDKTFSKGEKMTYDFDGTQRTGIKLSNGAQTAIGIPDGFKVTKIVFWSVTANNASNRTSYWKEVAGQTYTEADGQILSFNATASAPNKAEFVLNNVQKELTFANAGEQQSVIIVLEYHTGGDDTGIEAVTIGEILRVEYFTLSGERVATPTKGLYLMRTYLKNGQVSSKKVVF